MPMPFLLAAPLCNFLVLFTRPLSFPVSFQSIPLVWSFDLLSLTLCHSSPFVLSVHPTYHRFYIPLTLHLRDSKMRLHQFLIILALLVGIAFSCVHDSTEPDGTIEEPTTSQDQPEVLRLQLRDITKQLDYKCGPKYGSCPSGTCCSSSGE